LFYSCRYFYLLLPYASPFYPSSFILCPGIHCWVILLRWCLCGWWKTFFCCLHGARRCNLYIPVWSVCGSDLPYYWILCGRYLPCLWVEFSAILLLLPYPPGILPGPTFCLHSLVLLYTTICLYALLCYYLLLLLEHTLLTLPCPSRVRAFYYVLPLNNVGCFVGVFGAMPVLFMPTSSVIHSAVLTVVLPIPSTILFALCI
jgi:hypothetical protein